MPDVAQVNNIDDYQDVDFSIHGIEQVWILAASIGGPEAVSKFLNEFTGEEKIFFIIIQHMDKEFLPMMAEQFNKSCKLSVQIPISGMKFTSTNCIVLPTNEFVLFNRNGSIELEPITGIYAYTPCIDACCKKLVVNIKNVNIAIFSGMSTDGIEAANLIKKQVTKL